MLCFCLCLFVSAGWLGSQNHLQPPLCPPNCCICVLRAQRINRCCVGLVRVRVCSTTLCVGTAVVCKHRPAKPLQLAAAADALHDHDELTLTGFWVHLLALAPVSAAVCVLCGVLTEA